MVVDNKNVIAKPADHRGLAVSVVVPVYNGGKAFLDCLASLKALDPSPKEIIVVADSDTDGSGRRAEERGFLVLRTSRRVGPAKTRNLGAAAAKGDILFFLDADVVVSRRAIEHIEAAFEGNPGLVALFGSYDDSPAALNFLSQYKNLLHHYTHQTSSQEASTFWAACGAVRRDAFQALGGFDVNFNLPAIEDIDLGYRLKKAGYRIALKKDLQVKHLKRWSIGALLKTDLVYRAIPWTVLILRDRRFINDLNLKLSSRFSVGVAWTALAAVTAGCFRQVFFWPAGLLLLLLILLNLPVYRFFLRKRGFLFLLRVLPWHWLYFLYSGLGFAIGLMKHLLSARRPAS